MKKFNLNRVVNAQRVKRGQGSCTLAQFGDGYCIAVCHKTPSEHQRDVYCVDPEEILGKTAEEIKMSYHILNDPWIIRQWAY